MSTLETEPQAERKRVSIGASRDLPPGAHLVIEVEAHKVAVFNVDGKFFAVDNRCPHRGASLAQGSQDGTIVTCPLHQWQFDLQTGRCLGSGDHRLRQFEVFQAGDDLLLDVSPQSDQGEPTWNGIFRYLVRYGAMGWVSRFGSVDRIECAHGGQVVVQTRRGTEAGWILAGPTDRNGEGTSAKLVGEVLRVWTAEDQLQVDRLRRDDLCQILEFSQKLLSEREIPIEVVDCEQLFDAGTIVLYFLGEATAAAALAEVADELSETWQATILFESVAEISVPSVESGGCGSGGCGCSVGGGEP